MSKQWIFEGKRLDNGEPVWGSQVERSGVTQIQWFDADLCGFRRAKVSPATVRLVEAPELDEIKRLREALQKAHQVLRVRFNYIDCEIEKALKEQSYVQ